MKVTPMLSFTAMLVVASVPASAAPHSLLARSTVSTTTNTNITTNVENSGHGNVEVNNNVNSNVDTNINGGGDDYKGKHHPKTTPASALPVVDHLAAKAPRVQHEGMASVRRLTAALKSQATLLVNPNLTKSEVKHTIESITKAVEDLKTGIVAATKSAKPEDAVARQDFAAIVETIGSVATDIFKAAIEAKEHDVAYRNSPKELPSYDDLVKLFAGLAAPFEALKVATKSTGQFTKDIQFKLQWLESQYQNLQTQTKAPPHA